MSAVAKNLARILIWADKHKIGTTQDCAKNSSVGFFMAFNAAPAIAPLVACVCAAQGIIANNPNLMIKIFEGSATMAVSGLAAQLVLKVISSNRAESLESVSKLVGKPYADMSLKEKTHTHLSEMYKDLAENNSVNRPTRFSTKGLEQSM
jgi:hypothetical protein